MGDGEHRIEIHQFDTGIGFFEGFPDGRLFGGFTHLHEARRQCPKAATRFNGTAAQQYLPFPFRYRADHQFGIDVMNHAAAVAQMSCEGVAVRHPVGEAASALRTEFQLMSGSVEGMVLIGFDWIL